MDLEAGEAIEVGRSHIIKRPRLTQLLDETKARIILLVAPAGYGKTTLARKWLADKPHAWYRGSTASADVAALALGLARAAASIVPNAGERLEARLRISKAPSGEAERLADLLAQDLVAWPRDAILAIDDYQFACDSEEAERLFEAVVSSSGVRIVVATRTRPRWATARRTLYGEILEIGRYSLSMTVDEARAALSARAEINTDDLLALADGWPALIGVASLTSATELPRDSLPEEIYDFFAEELYQAAEPTIRSSLRLLALAPYVKREIAEGLLGPDAEVVLARGQELGFLDSRKGRVDLHPLLKSFLASKFRLCADDPRGAKIGDLVRLLGERREWDSAFELASLLTDNGLLIDLLDACHSEMLDQGRLPTVSQWTMAAKTRGCDSPIVDLVDAELAFRGGQFARAEALARQAARRFPTDHGLTSRAFWIAGTSARLSSDDDKSLIYFTSAEETAQHSEAAQQGIWGQFLSHEALEREDEAALLLARFVERSGATVDDLLRAATGQFRMATLRGDISGALADHEELIHLAERARDPLIRSSFFVGYVWLLDLAGRYQEALAALETLRDFTRESFLDFVEGWAFQLSGTAMLGLRHFRSARAEIGRCARAGASVPLLACSASWLLARLELATNRPQAAAQTLDRVFTIAKECRPAHAEHLAWRALVYAILGQTREALELSSRAESLSRRVEITGLVPWIKTILAPDRVSASELAASAMQATLASGNVDSFVTVYRSYPDILRLLVANDQHTDSVLIILEKAHDIGLAKQIGLPIGANYAISSPYGLTARERETLDLVSQGMTNKEIGRTLFIEEVTVKAHMRSVYRKLGVRTRTEAAMRASEFND
jgi:LuxR family maltose regulon positive regulatory protein